MQSNIEILTQAACNKFGEVLAIKAKVHQGEYKLVIKRDQPAIPDLPYMTITGAVAERDGKVVPHFYWGHYDLTEAKAFAVVNIYKGE